MALMPFWQFLHSFINPLSHLSVQGDQMINVFCQHQCLFQFDHHFLASNIKFVNLHMSTYDIKSPSSPRALALLFMFLRLKSLKVVSYVELTAKSKCDMQKKIKLECFSENPYFVTHPQIP